MMLARTRERIRMSVREQTRTGPTGTGPDGTGPAGTGSAEPGDLLKALATPAGRADPYPVYAALRESAPVYVTGNGSAYLTRYDDCLAVTRDAGLGAQSAGWMDTVRPGWREHPGLRVTHESFVFRNPPDHTRLRKQVSREFTQRKAQALRRFIADKTGQVLDAVAEAGSGGGAADLHEILAASLPISVVGKILGVPEADHPRLRTPLEGLRLAVDGGATAATLPVIDQAAVDLTDYFAGLVAERRQAPADDLISSLIAIRDADDAADGQPPVLTEEEMLQTILLIFSAAIESMVDLLLIGTAALLEYPDQAARLRADPGLAKAVVEEALRYDAPVQAVGRIPAADVTIGGVAIPAGTYILPMLGAGNRDPARFDDPDTFDLTRTGPAPLSFSGGAHFCLGAALARMEAAVFLPALVRRFPDLAHAEPPVRRGFVLRGFASFPISVS
jgi:cytochrome P450